jgi:hypothetical protein
VNKKKQNGMHPGANPSPVPPGWPGPLQSAALYGLLGDIISAIEPHTEADPAALVLQFLGAFGNVVGRNPHFKVEADRHRCNLFIALVGKSARGRKGTSWGYVREMFSHVDRSWTKKRIQPGLSTGEGLIQAIADTRVDPTAPDKRLMIVEDEMSAVLRVMSRYGNTLSTTLRRAWDGQTLQVMTRESPLRASGAHISIIAQTTQHDLDRYLNQTDIFNGFSNRFLWGCVRRSKLLPSGGGVEKRTLTRLERRLKKSVEFAMRQRQVNLSANATRLWESVYPQLTVDIPGLVGAATSRAEAQVRRIALIYALMDLSNDVRTKHLRAALAVWRFCSDSASFIFGDRSESSIENKLLSILKTADKGQTRTDISNALRHHIPSETITHALEELRVRGLVRSKQCKTAGRFAEVWSVPLEEHLS